MKIPSRIFSMRSASAGALFLFLLLSTGTLHGEAAVPADGGPHPPCGGAAFPSYPVVDQPPVVRAWENGDLGRDWTPPECTGWTGQGFTTLVAAAGRFRCALGAGELLRRVGTLSAYTGIRYWSTSRKRWERMISDAYALPGPAGESRCGDFSPDDMAEGRPLYFRQQDNVFGKVTYLMRVRSCSPDRLVFETENVSAAKNMLVCLFNPGEIRSVVFLERESNDVWRYYCVLRTGRGANPLTAGHAASYINRVVAFYRYLAGIPTDREPPAAP